MGASASREKFRESVSALIEIDVSPDDADFWDELWKIPSSAEEVFELITPEAARKLRDKRFENLATLFTQATAQLCQIVETPYNIYFDQALNCVRVLTRILPFLLEKGDLGDSDANVEHLCWGIGSSPPGEGPGSPGGGDDALTGLVIGGSASGADGESSMPRGEDDEDDSQEPLALLVVHAAMHMLFLPQFTCDFYEDDGKADAPPGTVSLSPSGGAGGSPTGAGGQTSVVLTEAELKKQEKEDREAKADAGLVTKIADSGVSLVPTPTSIIWAAGAGVSPNQLGYDGGTRKYDKNRVEVLRLLLAACCDPLFAPADEYNPLASRWMAVAVAADAPNSICLFYSLLNTILSYDPNGIGVPYSSSFASDTHVRLVELSAQLLCVLLDCGLPGSPEPVTNEDGEPVVEFDEAARGGFNIFRTLLARIDSGRELSFIFKGFVRLLRNVYESQNTYLPNSKAKLECFQELLVLFWKLLEENPLFTNHILTQCDTNEVIVPICYLMYQSRRDPARIGLVHICTFVLLKLSGERSFGVNLNKPFLKRLPCDLPLFSGSHADLVTITLHKLIVNGAYKLVPLYSCFITVICNISPYWRKMSLVAAVKLVNLFELFSSPKFLYSGENAHRHLALLLEVFNNIIQYQFTGNQHMVYAIIRRKDSFGRLASLTLPKAIAQCDKVYGDQTTTTYDADADAAKDIISTTDVDGSGNPVGMSKKTSRYASTDVTSAASTALSDVTSVGGDTNGSSVVGDHFVPTEEWLAELKATLPLETVTRLLQHLVPVVDEMCARKNGVVDEAEILEMLQDVTMVGLLPVPHAIVIRKYQPNQYTALWFTAFLWGVVFLRNQSPIPMFDGEAIELFQVSVSQGDD
mmetsp:Transcript_7122/g.14897  ORF Transcript_7122/g.14897 Transcript_7122/m.14897 type:complete len:865 (+) Transcript_7122:177-2771(+)|eukprot:CAMPEP_0178484472 /NCGR_PEP_ID=MMETSP0696-20121128/7770_1 /TAXON_ID=265572 /ORGANISM="Extubocellulus spinifer, Strain CCMP396" /LENGTH=864 /DNA_ID=CAMNT_0020112027 /DNA_START=163 /DNA_END=2760 /DNA_ORIENTATION=-